MELFKKPLKEMTDEEFELVVKIMNEKLREMKKSPENMEKIKGLINK